MLLGELTSRLTSDTTTMAESLGLNTNVFLRSSIKASECLQICFESVCIIGTYINFYFLMYNREIAVGVCVFMFRISWRMSMVTVVGLPIIMAVSDAWGTYYQVTRINKFVYVPQVSDKQV